MEIQSLTRKQAEGAMVHATFWVCWEFLAHSSKTVRARAGHKLRLFQANVELARSLRGRKKLTPEEYSRIAKAAHMTGWTELEQIAEFLDLPVGRIQWALHNHGGKVTGMKDNRSAA